MYVKCILTICINIYNSKYITKLIFTYITLHDMCNMAHDACRPKCTNLIAQPATSNSTPALLAGF